MKDLLTIETKQIIPVFMVSSHVFLSVRYYEERFKYKISKFNQKGC